MKQKLNFNENKYNQLKNKCIRKINPSTSVLPDSVFPDHGVDDLLKS